MKELEDKKQELEKVKEIYNKLNDIQQELIWCMLESKTYMFLINIFDLLYYILDYVKKNKYKEIDTIEKNIQTRGDN